MAIANLSDFAFPEKVAPTPPLIRAPARHAIMGCHPDSRDHPLPDGVRCPAPI